uniref:Alpha-glucosidase n=1 Tax=Timema shepardi TaxID=629360 RepID=A0A7R9FZS2_TIMSH|nr:unnamed protein product [Timema shepardi]
MLQSMYDLFEFDGAWIGEDENVRVEFWNELSEVLNVIVEFWNELSEVLNVRVEFWNELSEVLNNREEVSTNVTCRQDMNEPSNFLDGSSTGCADNSLNNPPFTPGVSGGSLISRTVCMDADQYAGKHYNLHNMYGFTEAIVTSTVLSEIRQKRPFAISRSSFVGLGSYVGHWSGDISSSWGDMAWTVPELLSMSLFGIPLMGADICGFNGNTNNALCQRWMELGAFYPFSRNHNGKGYTAQDPASLGEDVVAASKKALLVRYSLLPYLYTLFYEAHTDGSTVVTPIFFEFPSDESTYSIDTAFMWGSGLLIAPVLTEATTQVDIYLPSAQWYDFYTGALLTSGGADTTLDAPLDTIPLLVRGGHILPMQEPGMTTTASRKNNFQLMVASDESGSASGELYWDDGDTLEERDLYWDTLGETGRRELYWDTLGETGRIELYWDTLGETRRGSYTGTLLVRQGRGELYWDTLGETRRIELYWDTLGRIELYWDTLGETGRIELYWDTLGETEERSYTGTLLVRQGEGAILGHSCPLLPNTFKPSSLFAGTYEAGAYTLVSFSLQSSQLTGTPKKTGYTGENMNLATITVLGVSSASSVTANGGSATFTYDGTNKVLTITGLSISLSDSFTVTWS